jgi:hypothetical protein
MNQLKKFFLVLASASVLFGSLTFAADAAESGRAYRHHHHYRVCRLVKVRRVVWRHHHRHVVYYKVRRCHWV